MKKVKFSGKLNLNKETVTQLNQEQMTKVVGGVAPPPKKTQLNTCGWCHSLDTMC